MQSIIPLYVPVLAVASRVWLKGEQKGEKSGRGLDKEQGRVSVSE